MTEFGSLLTASITPFDSRGVLNTDTLWRLCRKLVHDKSEGLVLTGTTGESPNLSIKDREIIYSTACLLYTSPSPRDKRQSRMPSSA